MFDTVILLGGPAEQTALPQALLAHNPRLAVESVATADGLATLAPELLGAARLVAFCTDVIVPAPVLDRLGYGAYNFHPGSPLFPGFRPAHFALQAGVTEFGANAHRMIEEVDAGPIVGVEMFAVPPDADVVALETMAYSQLAKLFWQLALPLATEAAPLPELPIRWSGKKGTRRRLAAMGAIEEALIGKHRPLLAAGLRTSGG
ncbi:MAG TPA: formyltransferase family protein [Xanthobacteraceae bacterium]|nr:formyltransferase family protein [Xanthobacteraceae bacterium]